MVKIFVFKCSVILFTIIQFALQCNANGGYGVGGYAGTSGGGSRGVGQIHMPHQLLNVLDLLIPFHVRVATDGVKHKP